jgi:hypothetical protein
LPKSATTIGSRLRDFLHGSGGRAGTIFCRTRQGEGAHCRRGKTGRGARRSHRPRGGQPPAGLYPLPDMSHFAAEFYECCADPAARFLTFAKVGLHRTNLLAMQRGSL